MKRPVTIKVDASGVQGEGAYVEWVRLTWGERKEALEKFRGKKGDALTKFFLEMLFSRMTGWNFVDREGNPLPVPQKEEDLEVLYEEEVNFLFDMVSKAVLGELFLTPEAAKN